MRRPKSMNSRDLPFPFPMPCHPITLIFSRSQMEERDAEPWLRHRLFANSAYLHPCPGFSEPRRNFGIFPVPVEQSVAEQNPPIFDLGFFDFSILQFSLFDFHFAAIPTCVARHMPQNFFQSH